MLARIGGRQRTIREFEIAAGITGFAGNKLFVDLIVS
jgi:hypothetical protein